MVRREIVLDNVKPLFERIAASEVLEEGKMLSRPFSDLVVCQKHVVFQVQGGMKISDSMESAIGRPALCGLAQKGPLVPGLRTDLQRTELVQADHPCIRQSSFLDLPVQRDNSFFLDSNLGSLDSFQVLVF